MLAKTESASLIYSRRIESARLFIDCVDGKLLFNDTGDLVPHNDGAGYQRNPWNRIEWLEQRVDAYDPHLMRHLEVSARADGTYAIIDGGGRFLLAMLVHGAGKSVEFDCRIHEGLTRSEEADLFVKMDKQKVGLGAIHIFLAAVAAKVEESIAVSDNIAPYRVAVRGRGSLKCVGQLELIYRTSGVRLLSRTARVVAATWGKYENAVTGFASGNGGVPVDGQAFMSVALALISGVDEGKLRQAMVDNFPRTLKAKATENMPPMKTNATGVEMANKLVKLAQPKGYKAFLQAIENHPLTDAYRPR